MANPYQPPQAKVSAVPADTENNSGGGKSIVIPDGIKGWSWGAFLLIPVVIGILAAIIIPAYVKSRGVSVGH